MFNIRKQIYRLLAVSGVSSFQLAGASWVALLAARGFSLVEIGMAEACFHAASLAFEIPSGVISDVFGRRKSMMLSQLMFMASALCMAFAESLAGVCIALVMNAFGYNFASGAREALAYDSLKSAGQQDKYIAFSAREMVVYRMGGAAAILCAGLALAMGHRRAYLLDACLAALGFCLASRLQEVQLEEKQFSGSIAGRIMAVFRESTAFLAGNLPSFGLMLINALLGAVCILTAFFLQARLSAAGVGNVLLGPALFVISMGGAAGAAIAAQFKGMQYGRLYLLCAMGALMGVACAAGTSPVLMLIGGFAANLCDDLLQVRTDAMLNDRFPSAQRATLVSVESLIFSMVMILLSPLAGMFFA